MAKYPRNTITDVSVNTMLVLGYLEGSFDEENEARKHKIRELYRGELRITMNSDPCNRTVSIKRVSENFNNYLQL